MNNQISSFQKDIILLDEPQNRSFFPENFGNEIYYSKLKASSIISYRSNFSIKYVIKGREAYLLDGKKHFAQTGEYLLVNEGRTVETTEEWGSEAMSIFLDKGLINEVYTTFESNEESLLDIGVDKSFSELDFFETNFSHHDTLGLLLQELYKQLTSVNDFDTNLPKETYYLLAEKLIQSQKNVRHQIGNINTVKKQTREELYRRALIAKDYIHETAEKEFNLDLLAQNAGLSKFHLIRVFKSVFSLTPYQYYIFNKVRLAKKLLLGDNESIQSVASIAGFTDIASFSKTFKKIAGVTPSAFARDTK